jgi:hypothetical protein
LHERTGDGDGAFEGVHRRLGAEPVRQCRQQAVLRGYGLLAVIHQQEAAGAVGILGLAGFEAGLADEGRVLVAQDPGDGDAGE